MLKGNRTKKAKNNFEKKRIKLDILYYPIVWLLQNYNNQDNMILAKDWWHRSIKQNRNTRNTHTSIMTKWFFNRGAKTSDGERLVFSTSGAGTSTCKKNKLQTKVHTLYKN